MVKKKKQRAMDEEEDIEIEDEDFDFDLDKPATDEDDDEEEVEDSDEDEEEVEDSDEDDEEAEDSDEEDDEEAEDSDEDDDEDSCANDSAIPPRKLKRFKRKGRRMMKMSFDSLPREVMEHIAARDHLANRLRPVIGDFAYDSMDLETLAKYACDALELGVSKSDSVAAIHGYLCGKEQMAQQVYSMDSAIEQSCNVADAQIEAYLKGE